MLDKDLDKLRDKTLSFGCLFSICKGGRIKRYLGTRGNKEFIRNEHYNVYKKTNVGEFPKGLIIGHPLTRGRIEHYYRNNGTDYKYTLIYIKIRTRFENSRETAYNQSEIERMQHKKRPELKELLLKFSNYL